MSEIQTVRTEYEGTDEEMLLAAAWFLINGNKMNEPEPKRTEVNGYKVIMPDNTVQLMLDGRSHSSLINLIMDVKQGFETRLRSAESFGLEQAKRENLSLVKTPDFLNNYSPFKNRIFNANQFLWQNLQQFDSSQFGRKGAFAPVKSVKKVNKGGTFSYNRVNGTQAQYSLTPSQIYDVATLAWKPTWDFKLESRARKVSTDRGSRQNLTAEVAAGVAMSGHYYGQRLVNGPYLGVILFDEHDAMTVASWITRQTNILKTASYSQVAAAAKFAMQYYVENDSHMTSIMRQTDIANFLADHVITRLVDAEVLTTHTGAFFQLGARYEGKQVKSKQQFLP
jgi:hypothetical protein